MSSELKKVERRPGFRLPVHGAPLVAPCGVDDAQGLEQIRSFVPVPASKLNFPTLAVVSSADPYLSDGRALAFAHGRGARVMLAGARGHISAESGFGPWSEGEALLRELLSRKRRRRAERRVDSCSVRPAGIDLRRTTTPYRYEGSDDPSATAIDRF